MAKSPTSEVIELKNVRLSFPQIWKAKAFRNPDGTSQNPSFQAAFLMDLANVEHQALLAKLKSEMVKLAGDIPVASLKLCVTKGDLKPYDGYKGMMVLSARNSTRPTIVNRTRNAVAEGDDQAPYAGCYVNATITLWLQNNQWGKRINANLRAIQFVRDGEAFGRGPVDAEDEFEPLDDSPVAGAPAAADFDFN